jgi:hypothetical protein
MENNYNRRTDYTNAVDTELQRLVEELMRTYMRPQRQSNTEEDHIIFLRSLRDIMSGYNSNMLEYQTNTRMSLNLLQNYLNQISNNNQRVPTSSIQRDFTEIPIQEQVPERRRQTQTTNNRDHLLSYVIYRPTIRSQDATTLRNFFQNIIIRPTREQIDNSTELITYNRNLNIISHTCPITLDDFQDGDIVRQIKHCKHTFHEVSIQNWFRTNVRCPVCRYDIRDYREQRTSESQEEIKEETKEEQEEQEENQYNHEDNAYENIFQELSSNITQNIQDILTENLGENGILDSSHNYLFEFEIR